MEDLVTKEIAKNLKEKGYPQHIAEDAYIIDNYGEDKYQIGDRLPIPLIPDYMDVIAAPSISQVLKWLREKNAIHISCNIWKYGWYFSVTEYEYYEEDKEYDVKDVYSGYNYSTYEEAVIAGIEYVLDVVI